MLLQEVTLNAPHLAETWKLIPCVSECTKQVKFSLPQRRSLCCFLVVLDFEISELIGVLAGSKDSKEFLKILFLEVFLGKILEVSLGEWDLGFNNNGIFISSDGDVGSEVSGFVLNLDSLGKIVNEILKDNNVILNWEFAVNVEFLGLDFLGTRFGGDGFDHFVV